MAEALVHDRLQVTYPEGFLEMDADALKRVYLDDNPNRWGIWDRKRHLMFVVYWQESNKVLTWMVSTNSLIKRAEKLSAKGYRANGYRLDGFFSTKVAGIEAEGFRFTYEVDGVTQQAETIIFMRDSCCYTLYWYERKGACPTSEQAHDEILGSLSLA